MRILVAVASRHGSTKEIAESVGQSLALSGFATDVRSIEEVDGLDAYGAVVLGSAVYYGHWMASARGFAEANAEALRLRPTWLFSSGPIGSPPRPVADDAVDVAEVLEATGSRGHRLFAGRVDRSALTFHERAVVAAVRGSEGDFRDWDEVAAWAAEIAQALRSSLIA